MLATPFTMLVGCEIPLQQAGMGGVATAALAAAVGGAGALGMIGGVMVPPPALAGMLDGIGQPSRGAVGVNFLMPFVDRAAVEVAASRARVVQFFYGEPDTSLVELVHAGGALAAWQVGSVEEAVAAVRAGARFVAAREADVHPEYAAALIAAGAGDTVLTEAFSVMWPDAPHRVLRSCVAAVEAYPGESVGEMESGGVRMPIPRFAVPCPNATTTGNIAAMALYAGESVGAVRAVEPAAAIVRELADGAERLLRQW